MKSESTTPQPVSQESPVFRHVMPLQIRWNDTDKFGHVNNSVYFQFYDTAKTDYLSTVTDVDWEHLAIMVVHIEANFLSEVKSDSRIAARTCIFRIGHKSFHLMQEVIDAETQEVKCRCTSVMVLYDLQRHEAVPLPEKWVRDICEYEGRDLTTDN